MYVWPSRSASFPSSRWTPLVHVFCPNLQRRQFQPSHFCVRLIFESGTGPVSQAIGHNASLPPSAITAVNRATSSSFKAFIPATRLCAIL